MLKRAAYSSPSKLSHRLSTPDTILSLTHPWSRYAKEALLLCKTFASEMGNTSAMRL